MKWRHTEPQAWPQAAGVSILAANPGEARDAIVERWLGGRRDAAATTGSGPVLRLRCRPHDGGTWAGLATLVEHLLPSLRAQAPVLLARHAWEVCLVAPALRSELGFPESLTDTVDDDEKTRNYPADRAYRCLHGLIELLDEWQQRSRWGAWSLACDDHDEANPLMHRFLTELVRRRGRQLGLQLLVITGESHGEEAAAQFDPACLLVAVGLALPASDAGAARSPAAAARLAADLETMLPADPTAREQQLPRLIDTWRSSSTPERALRWEITLMARYNHAGIYEAGLRYAADVEAGLERLLAEDPDRHFEAVTLLYFCYVPLGRADDACRIVERALEASDDARRQNHLYYLLAMLHARFLAPTDQDLAERYLRQSIDVLPDADLSDAERHFLTVFSHNGLALVRLRQGRVSEALELCRDGVARLGEHLDPDRHRLHRSVLLFNIGQVHAQIGPYEDAIDYFTQAMAMDPNYSEYYNDRGAVYFKMGLLEHAERDYRRAIELSPPYAEVWTNLGQCYRQLGRMQEAADAYTRSLDLEPGSPLALAGRADAEFALGRAEPALLDYSRALKLDPHQALVLAGRAVVQYERGCVREAATDLDLAVELAPEIPELYQNRAVALRDLGRPRDAARDLRTYLKLCPDAPDRDEVREQMAELAALSGRA